MLGCQDNQHLLLNQFYSAIQIWEMNIEMNKFSRHLNLATSHFV